MKERFIVFYSMSSLIGRESYINKEQWGGKMNKVTKLKKENRILRETCEVLADKRLMQEIKESLLEIKAGKISYASKF